MKAGALILLFFFCFVECRKVYAPINKNANIDFINMEMGGSRVGPTQPQPKAPTPAPAAPTPKPAGVGPAGVPAPTAKPVQPIQPAPTPAPAPVKPHQPNQIKPVPVNPAPVANPITTPGPGSVKSLVNFYDSRGNASPIRPYSYSQAVKQG